MPTPCANAQPERTQWHRLLFFVVFAFPNYSCAYILACLSVRVVLDTLLPGYYCTVEYRRSIDLPLTLSLCCPQ